MFDQSHVDASLARTKAKKAAVPRGPWNDEPDRIEFRHHGVPCLMIRHEDLLHWCGYAGVSPGHPDYGKGYDDVDVDVHGGLTFARACNGHVCHKPAEGEPDELWWFGFDCAHLGDLSPAVLALRQTDGWRAIVLSDETYRDVSWVREETMRLAEALADRAGGADDAHT